MQIIPAIDLLDGNCVRLIQGDYDKVTSFNNDPIEQALLWEQMGAERIHVVDLDGAKKGKSVNKVLIISISNKLSIPIQVGGGIRDKNTAQDLLDKGIDRIILGTAALENPSLVQDLSEKYPQKIIVGIDAKQEYVSTRGWLYKSEVKASELARNLSEYNLAAIIYTDIAKDGMLMGPNIKQLKDVANSSSLSLIHI